MAIETTYSRRRNDQGLMPFQNEARPSAVFAVARWWLLIITMGLQEPS